MTSLLNVQNISFSFPGRSVLEDLSFEAHEGNSLRSWAAMALARAL